MQRRKDNRERDRSVKREDERVDMTDWGGIRPGDNIRCRTRKFFEIVSLVDFEPVEIYENMRDVTASRAETIIVRRRL